MNASTRGSRPHLVHVFPAFGVGGSQVRFAAIVAALGDSFSHTVVSLNGCLEAVTHLDPAVDVQIAPPLDSAGGLASRLGRYRSYLKAISPDLLVTYNWGAMEFAIANLGRSTPHIHVEDGFGPEEAVRQFPRRVWMRRLVLSRSQVVAPSATLNEIATRVWRLDQRRVHWIPNGIAERDAWSTSLQDLGLGLPPGLPIVVWAGAIRAEKNPLRLLRAFAAVKDRAVLLMIGEGSERGAVEEEIRRLGLTESTRLLGQRTDARDLIMQCDVLVLSSDTEQMPLVVLEAMDAGLAVVSTDVGDVRRMVAPINAPFVGSSDTDLASALSAVIADDDLRRRIGVANRARRRDQYALGTMIDRWRALFEKYARST
jgi:glycosyltransferase involved in cell wall biosynthesis